MDNLITTGFMITIGVLLLLGFIAHQDMKLCERGICEELE